MFSLNPLCFKDIRKNREWCTEFVLHIVLYFILVFFVL